MSKLVVSVVFGVVVCASPCVAQNAPWPPPAGMSLHEYLRRYGGDELRRANPEFYRSLPEPPRQYTPPGAAAGSNPYAGLRPEYNWNTGKYELLCPDAGKSDPYAGQRSVFNSYTGHYEFPCARK